MKNLFSALGLVLFLIAASVTQAGVPAMNVTVSDSAGKAAFRGTTKSDGGFATAKLVPGNYVVQFSAKNSPLKGEQFSIVVVAGKKKVVANAVAGERFLGGGVAMKVEVGEGLNITGQVWAGTSANNTHGDTLRKMQDHAQDAHQEGFRPSMSDSNGKPPSR